jgi:hypothetical protein
MNLAEDIQIERKMKKKNVIGLLAAMLERDNLKLLEVSVVFLKKLSVFAENKNQMHQKEGVVEKLARFLPCPHHSEFCMMLLRLINNLCFDSGVRLLMDSLGYIPKLVLLLKAGPFRGITIRILYLLSMEDKCKSTFTYTECIPLVYILLIQFPEQKVGTELVGLAINLAQNARNAEVLANGDQLSSLMKRALSYQDDLLMKLVRTVASNSKSEQVQTTLTGFAEELVNQALTTDDQEYLVEVLGTLVHIAMPDKWPVFLRKTELLNFLRQHLVVGFTEDDILLECLMLTGTVLTHRKSAKLMVDSKIITNLHTLLSEKQDDDEMVYQLMFVFYRMLLYPETRAVILGPAQIVEYLLELLQDKNPRIRKMADSVLAVVQDFDSNWKQEILSKRFLLHNHEWLEAMAASEEVEYDDSEDEGSEEGPEWLDAENIGSVLNLNLYE